MAQTWRVVLIRHGTILESSEDFDDDAKAIVWAIEQGWHEHTVGDVRLIEVDTEERA